MNPAIEQILSADEAARATVERAEKDAARLIADAETEAQDRLLALEEQIREIDQQEIQPIVADGQHQAELTLKQAEDYSNELKLKIASGKTRIIDSFIGSIVKTGMD